MKPDLSWLWRKRPTHNEPLPELEQARAAVKERTERLEHLVAQMREAKAND